MTIEQNPECQVLPVETATLKVRTEAGNGFGIPLMTLFPAFDAEGNYVVENETRWHQYALDVQLLVETNARKAEADLDKGIKAYAREWSAAVKKEAKAALLLAKVAYTAATLKKVVDKEGNTLADILKNQVSNEMYALYCHRSFFSEEQTLFPYYCQHTREVAGWSAESEKPADVVAEFEKFSHTQFCELSL